MSLDRIYPAGSEDISGSDFMEEMKAEGEAKWARVTDRLLNVAGRNAISANAAVTITAYSEGMGFLLIPVLTNTGPVTLDIDEVGGTSVVDRDGAALPGGSLVAGRLYQLRRISSAFRIVTGGEGGADAAAAFVAAHTRANNTAGGTATAGSWLTYPLTTVLTNDLSEAGAALSSNQITLPAGTYDVQAAATFFRTGYSRIRLRNTTDGSTVALGAAPARTGTAVDEMSPATLGGRFTIAAQKVFEVQYRVVTTNADDGLGTAANFTEDELFGYISFVAAPKDGGPGANGPAGNAPGVPLIFSTTTTAADPTAGKVRFNSGTFGSINGIYLSATPDGGGDLDAWIESFGLGTSNRRGTLLFADPIDPSVWAQFDVVGAPVDNSGWWTISVEPLSEGESGGVFTDAVALRAAFSRTGDRGRDFRPDIVVDTESERDAAVDGDTPVGYAVLVRTPEEPLEGPHLFFLVTPSVSPPPEWSLGIPFGTAVTWTPFEHTFTGSEDSFDTEAVIGEAPVILFVGGVAQSQVAGDFEVSGSNIVLSETPSVGTYAHGWVVGGLKGEDGEQGQDGEPGADGTDPGVFFNWDDSTSVGDPGSGKIAGNHVNLQSVTTLSISKENRAGDSVAAWLARFDDSTAPHKGTLVLTKPSSDAQAIYAVTAISVEADHVEVAVTHDGGAMGSAFMEGPISVQFAGTGNKGADGAGNVSTVNLVEPVDGDVMLEAGNIPTDAGGTFEGDDVETVLDALDGRITDAEADISGKADTAALDDYVAEALFDANTILAANSDNTPAAVVVAEQRIVGRLTGGNIGALDHSGVRSVAKIVVIEETDYDALDPPDADTIYFVIEDA